MYANHDQPIKIFIYTSCFRQNRVWNVQMGFRAFFLRGMQIKSKRQCQIKMYDEKKNGGEKDNYSNRAHNIQYPDLMEILSLAKTYQCNTGSNRIQSV